MSNQESKKFDIKMFDVTKENVIREIKMSKLFYLTKDGEFLGYTLEGYLEKMSKYSEYCKEEEKDNWLNSIKDVISMVNYDDDYSVISNLSAFEDAGEIMEHLANGASWEEIKKMIKNQGHSGMSIILLAKIMLRYSKEGSNFTKKVVGEKSIDLLDSLNKLYSKENVEQKSLVKRK